VVATTNTLISLLSLIPPSYIVVSIRELVNINITLSTTTKALSSNVLDQTSSNMEMDIDMDTMRGRPLFLSHNSSKEFFILSKESIVPYYKRIEIQSNTLG